MYNACNSIFTKGMNMPALQVREFPSSLYDELKECAARNHRSIAQQTIIAVEEMLMSKSCSEVEKSSQRNFGSFCSTDRESAIQAFSGFGMIDFNESFTARATRAEKRRQLFEEFNDIRWKESSLSTKDIVTMSREGRDELSNRDQSTPNAFRSEDGLHRKVSL